jgi:hypothetical protein
MPQIRSQLKMDEVRYQRILRGATPSKSAHAKYLRSVTRFGAACMELADSGADIWEQIPVQEFNVVRSELFGSDYLVGYVDAGWFASVAPSCDAIAAPEIRLGPLTSPPLVLVPAVKRRTKTAAFHSVLEHEFVHVNQAILGLFPTVEGIREKPISNLLAHTQA